MDLTNFYNTVEQYALNTVGVETFTIGDPYITWNALHITYGAFNVALNYVEYNSDNGTAELHLTMYYAGKQKNDSSNIYDLQSDGFKVIRNVIRHLVENYEIEGIEDLQLYPYAQKFADACAGAYADVVVYVPIEDDDCDWYDKPEPEPEPEPDPDDNNDDNNG